MSISTKTGDDGTTSLYGGKRLWKSDLPVEAYGSIDELTSFLGLIICKTKNYKEKHLLTSIQKCLQQIMALLAEAEVKNFNLQSETKIIEKNIILLEKKLPKIHWFILPQGKEISCLFHIARTICRKAERRVIKYLKNKKNSKKMAIIPYLNRLSDLFFLLARKHNI